MRLGLVRYVGLGISALALVWLAGCDDNPLSFEVKDTADIVTNPSEMVIPAGRTSKLESRAVNQGLEATFEAVAATVDPSCGAGAITVVDDPDNVDLMAQGIIPPGRFAVTGGSTLGTTCINLAAGGQTATVDVTVVAEAIQITSAPDTLRAGTTGTVVAQLVDAAGGTVTPYDAADVAWASSDEDVASFSDAVGNFDAGPTSGTAVLSATWNGQAANGTVVAGVSSTAQHVLAVIPAQPVAAQGLDNGDDFGVIRLGQAVESEVVVVDAFGNQNNLESDITGCTAVSSDALIATASCAIELASAHAVVTVTGVATGTGVTVSGTVTTSGGTFNWGPAPVTVVDPVLVGLAPAVGFVGTAITLTGTGLTFPGFQTDVVFRPATATGVPVTLDPLFIGGLADTQIDLWLPQLGVATDWEVSVSVGGVTTDPQIFTQSLDRPADEPANDSPGTPTAVAPGTIVSSFLGAEVDDFYLLNVPAGGDVFITLDWDDPSIDLDILFDDEGLPFNFPCGFPAATGAKPEIHTPCVVPPGNYLIWINNFSGADHPTSYIMTIAIN